MLNRRFFLGSVPAALATGTTLSAREPGKFEESEKSLPIVDDVDVIVCGGGPAGLSAAVAAARKGLRVRLFETHGCLGGVWTSGLLTFIFDFDKSDMGFEILRRLDAYHARRCESKRDFVYEPEYMKLVCEEMATEAGVKFLLHCPVVAAYKVGRKITTVVTESKSGRQAWRAKYFVDATGDGDLGAQAGCGFEMGNTLEGFGQPATLNALAVVRDASKMREFISNDVPMWGPGGHVDSYRAFLKELERAKIQPSYFNPTLFQVHENLLMIMVNHEYKVRVDDTQAVTAATVRARAEILRMVDALNRLGGVWEGMRVVSTAEQIGHRCGRRIHGLYTITRDDVAEGRHFDDEVTVSRFGVDIHAADFEKNKTQTIAHAKFRPFGIPLRSLTSRDVDNLFMAGRCISGDFIAHGSYRVTGSAVAMGEAVGHHMAVLADCTK